MGMKVTFRQYGRDDWSYFSNFGYPQVGNHVDFQGYKGVVVDVIWLHMYEVVIVIK